MITKGYVFDLGGVCTTHMNCSLVRRTVDKMGLNWNCISPNERTTLRSKYDNGKISLIEFYRRRFPGISDEDANTLVSIDLESYL